MHLLLSQITKSQTIQFTNKIIFTSVKNKNNGYKKSITVSAVKYSSTVFQEGIYTVMPILKGLGGYGV